MYLFPVRSLRNGGFALTITLLLLALAAVVIVGLLTSASIERTTARAYDDRYLAEIAVRNGLESAKKALLASPDATSGKPPAVADDSFLVVRSDGPPNSVGDKPVYYFLAKAQANGNGAIDYYPLFSGGTPQNLPKGINTTSCVVTPPTAPSAAFATMPAQETFGTVTRFYPQLLPSQPPAFTQWVEVQDPNDTAASPNHNLPYHRFTYWIEDLSGYVDASVAGNIAGTSNTHSRPLDQSTVVKRYQTTPAELALFTLFDNTARVDPGNTGAKGLIENHSLLFTISTIRQLAVGAGNIDVTTPALATNIAADSELPLVPFGFGYKDEGDTTNTKLEINGQVSSGGDAAVKAIAQKINVNLPQFGALRQGGLAAGQNYVNSIAASIVDYADSDSDATLGTDYRGIDSYPLVSEIYTAKNWTKKYLNPSTGTYFVEITVDTWLELWNMTNQAATGTVSFTLSEVHPVHVGTTPTYSFGKTSADLHDNATVATVYPAGAMPLSVSMQPNEYKVLNVQTDTYQFNSGISPPDSFPAPSPASQSLALDLSETATRYEMTWKSAGSGGVVDRSNNGIVRVAGALGGPSAGKSNRNWRGSLPGFIGNNANGSANYYNTIGDPRLAYYWGCPQAPNGYSDNSSMGARNIRLGITTTIPPNAADFKEVKLTSWPDGGHNSPTVTSAPDTPTKDPSPPSPPLALESTKAPASISNAGSYISISELGNIYDPSQWNISPDTNNRWLDITPSTSSDANYGGGMTLRIGRPEFTRFDQPGSRAWQLLDLITVGNRVNTRGLVNINTASRDALRILGAAVLLNRDPDKLPAENLYPPSISTHADRFADAIISARPFLSTAQLSNLKIAGGSTGVFGDPAAWSGATQSQPTEWSDSGAEEYFAKIYPLATVRSRNFRVFVSGQALDRTGRVVSTVSKVYQIYLNPIRNATGAITSQYAQVTYEAQLSQ